MTRTKEEEEDGRGKLQSFKGLPFLSVFIHSLYFSLSLSVSPLNRETQLIVNSKECSQSCCHNWTDYFGLCQIFTWISSSSVSLPGENGGLNINKDSLLSQGSPDARLYKKNWRFKYRCFQVDRSHKHFYFDLIWLLLQLTTIRYCITISHFYTTAYFILFIPLRLCLRSVD